MTRIKAKYDGKYVTFKVVDCRRSTSQQEVGFDTYMGKMLKHMHANAVSHYSKGAKEMSHLTVGH